MEQFRKLSQPSTEDTT